MAKKDQKFPGLKILVAEKSSFSERGLAEYARLGKLVARDVTQTELAAAVAGHHILLVRLGLRVDEAVLAASRQLWIVATPTTGLDHIDVDAARARGIAILSLQGERQFLDQVYATAEHTIALMLSLVRKLPAAFEGVKRSEWRRDIYRGTELNGKTLGVIGYGRLGSMVAKYALGFDMQVLVYDPHQKELPETVKRCTRLTDLMKKSDIVTLHVPLNDDTRGMLGEKELAWMKPGAYLINTARGRVLDEHALLERLKSGKLAGAALDVLQDEDTITPGREHPLLNYAGNHDNLIITPHIGGATLESVEKADLFIAGKIERYLQALPEIKEKRITIND